MTDPTAGKLAALGAEQLADALLNLAGRNEDAARLVERLTGEPDVTGRRFKACLKGLRRRDRPIPYREAGSFAARLPLFVHERLSTKAILETVKRHTRDKQVEFDLFGDPNRPLGRTAPRL